jgi:hypothetical protein
MHDPVEKENEIMGTIKAFLSGNLDFVVIGGYAVSAFRHRFSIDADILIRREDRGKFGKILEERGYKKTISKSLEDVYTSEFARYEKTNPRVSIDLMIGGVASRQTGASFGFDFIFSNSDVRLIEGIENAVKARVPKREIQIIMKLHSGRLTDLRDVAALSWNLDMEIIRKHLFRGNLPVLKSTMKKLGSLSEEPNFVDSFKGVFREKGKTLDASEVKRLAKLRNGKRVR